MAANNEALIREFCEAWSRKDIDELIGFFTEHSVYHNIPTEPAKGHDAIRGVLNLFVPMAKEIEFKIENLASDGDVVITERVDRFVMEKGEISIRVAGVFEIRDGKIAAWRDYFDMQQFMSQMQAAVR